jgi:hypothetical protein
MNVRPSGPIPGAFEVRQARPAAEPTLAKAVVVTPSALDVPVYDRERLEREGGGAPSERAHGRRKTVYTRIFDFLLR